MGRWGMSQKYSLLQVTMLYVAANPFFALLEAISRAVPKVMREPFLRIVATHSGHMRFPDFVILTDFYSASNSIGIYLGSDELIDGFSPQKGDVVVDIGAHHGSYAIKAARHGARVIALEPDPSNFKILSLNIAANHLLNFEPINTAISDRDGTITLFLHRVSGCSTTVKEGLKPEEFGRWHHGRHVEVPCKTLDSVCAGIDLAGGLIKIDVEGAELSVLRGAGNTLRTPGIRLVIETHGFPLADAVKSELDSRGFEITLVPDSLGGSPSIYARLPEIHVNR
jgi:FkbM family methyltransferase